MKADSVPGRGPSPLAEGLRGALDAAFASGRRAHPTVPAQPEAFDAHVLRAARRRLAREGADETPAALAHAVASAATADLFLAAACRARAERAWEVLRENHASRLQALAVSRGAPPLDAEHLVTDLLSDLALPTAGGGTDTLLDAYDGTGSLFGWLATTLLRRWWNARARARVREGAGERTGEERAAPAAADPAVRAERTEVEGRIRAALAEALAGCTVGERTALLLTHREGLSGKETAHLLGVGAPRVSRLLEQATVKVRRALVPALKASGAAGPAEPGTWTTLRDAVSTCLAGVTIPPPPARPTHGRDADRKASHG